ncbi:flagellar hook-associated protein FlgK [Roseovarius autotrophicus]|uniref:flagellar hook-associated protein FlgK n=1 Tax=Roseovarius autotrophicus TaxID=2824121 RepID=UPI0019E97AAF|nr:flagellar hook-associated protein FlgK [Roseovarius autotrophicus]MBE0453063.1 flagellar hook-associated protein FlgK [Roseovarius sp.]
MTLTAALGNALTGLVANARMTDVIAGNLANMLTHGYAPREVVLQARLDSGVRVIGITRNLDPVLLADRRLADGAMAGADASAAFAAALERIIPGATMPGSLSDRLSSFEATLVAASARPEDELRLAAVLTEARGLASALNTASARIDTLRQQADAGIARAVADLNSGLERVGQINARIIAARSTGQETATLEDLRQQEVDALAALVPLRQLERANGSVALVTTGGALLLDGRAVTVAFDATRLVTADMSLEGGQLSGLSIDGHAIPVSGGGPLGGGRLGALFDNRDRLGPEAQRALDALARDLIERVETLTPPPVPALFTDAGARLDPLSGTGLAGRVTLNPVVDPGRGGAFFRFRTGPDAATPSAPAHAPYLAALAEALNAPRALDASAPARSLAGGLADLESRVAQTRLAAERAVGFAAGQVNELRALEMQGGVDSDAELQRLLLVEQAFAANARMIQTIDDMMQTLLRI